MLLDNSQLPFISISSDAPEYKIGYNTLRIVIDGETAWSHFRDKQKNGVYCSDELNGAISVQVQDISPEGLSKEFEITFKIGGIDEEQELSECAPLNSDSQDESSTATR